MDNWRKFNNFGQWHKKWGIYSVRIAYDGYDNYPNNFIARVQIRNDSTGVTKERKGNGKFIGNFSPIWVNWKGNSIQLEELLAIEED